MVLTIFGSWAVGVIIYYFSQKHGSKGMKIMLRIIAVVLIAWPFLLLLVGVLQKYFAKD